MQNNTGCPSFYTFAGLPCSGHGKCVDATAFSTHFAHLCECDSGWSGSTDVFDLRVALDTTKNKALALDCASNDIVSYFFFGLLLFSYGVRYLTIIKAFSVKVTQMPKKSRMERTYIRALWSYMPTRVLLTEIVLASPVFFAFPIQRLATIGAPGYDEMIIGTSISLTFCSSLGIFLLFVAFIDLQMSQFKTLAMSKMLNQDASELVVRHFNMNCYVEVMLYFLAVFLLPLVALGTQKELGPIASGEYIILIVRNIGVSALMIFRVFNSIRLGKEVQAILIPMQHSSEVSNVRGARDAAAKVLTYLKEQQHDLVRSAVVAATCYLVFCIPPFWPYQLTCIGFVVSLSSIANNEGLVFIRANRIADKANTSSAQGGSKDNKVSSSTSAQPKPGSVTQLNAHVGSEVSAVNPPSMNVGE